MIPRASLQRPGSFSKLCSSSPGFLGATIGTDREVEPAAGVGRPDVIAEQRRAPSSQFCNAHQASTRRWTANGATAALDWSGVG